MNIFKFLKKESAVWVYEQITEDKIYSGNQVMLVVSDERMPEDVVKVEDRKYVNFEKLVKNQKYTNQIEEFPTKASIKECIRDIQNGNYNKKVVYSFGDIVINAKYLLEALNYLGEDVTIEYFNGKTPLKIDNGDRQIYICPVCPNPKWEEGYFYGI